MKIPLLRIQLLSSVMLQEIPSPEWLSTGEGQSNSALLDFPDHFQYP